jgi:hypothetical protein
MPLALMAAGSLRDLITPLGYWAAWLFWALASAVLMLPGGSREALRPPAWVMMSYGMLVAGMALSGLVNQDGRTAFQLLKVIVIAVMFMTMWWLALRAEWRQLVQALYWVMALAAVSVVWTIMMDPQGQWPVIGGRQGSVLASYGVLWKVGALFLPIFVADGLAHPGSWKHNAVFIALSIYLVLVDGSRTAQLVVMATGAGLLCVLAWRGGWRVLFRKLRWWLLVPVLLVGVQLWDGGALSTRLGEGDPARVTLLREGIRQAVDCLPIGCGFGRTATDIGLGTPMAVHNAYLAALGDFGVLGLLGMLGFLVAAALPIRRVIAGRVPLEQGYFIMAAAGSALGYGMSLMLNTFTTEMSEWGYVILMLAFAWAPAKAACWPRARPGWSWRAMRVRYMSCNWSRTWCRSLRFPFWPAPWGPSSMASFCFARRWR